MSNLSILGDNIADPGNVSGGSWQARLPLTFMKTAIPTEVARSIDLAASSTTFAVDLLSVRAMSMFAFIGHNLTSSATIRIRVSNSIDGSSPLMDVTVSPFVPNVLWGSMPWGAFPWNGYRADNQAGPTIYYYKNPSLVYGQYVVVNFSDPGNPAGYVQFGRFYCGDPWSPQQNFNFGSDLRFLDPSVKGESRGGSLFWDKRPKKRQLSVQLSFLSKLEAMGVIYDLQNRLGLTGNLLVVYDPSDEQALLLKRTIYGSLGQLDGIVTASPIPDFPYSVNLSIEEII